MFCILLALTVPFKLVQPQNCPSLPRLPPEGNIKIHKFNQNYRKSSEGTKLKHFQQGPLNGVQKILGYTGGK